MRNAWIVWVTLVGGCAGKGGPGPVTSQPAGGGFWDVLAVPGSRWVLHDSMAERDPSPELAISVADVRQLGDARVVRLAGTVRYEPEGEPEAVSGALSIDGAQWAVTPRGLWMLDRELDDAAITAALAAPPRWAAPPRDVDAPTGRYSHVMQQGDETVACIGEVPDLGDEDCPDVCGGGMCVAARGGIVELDAQWAPDPYAIYEQDGYRRAARPVIGMTPIVKMYTLGHDFSARMRPVLLPYFTHETRRASLRQRAAQCVTSARPHTMP